MPHLCPDLSNIALHHYWYYQSLEIYTTTYLSTSLSCPIERFHSIFECPTLSISTIHLSSCNTSLLLLRFSTQPSIQCISWENSWQSWCNTIFYPILFFIFSILPLFSHLARSLASLSFVICLHTWQKESHKRTARLNSLWYCLSQICCLFPRKSLGL